MNFWYAYTTRASLLLLCVFLADRALASGIPVLMAVASYQGHGQILDFRSQENWSVESIFLSMESVSLRVVPPQAVFKTPKRSGSDLSGPSCLGEKCDFLLNDIDPVNNGFSDPSPAIPIGGNLGLTLGQQRFEVLKYALDLWTNFIDVNVPVVIQMSFFPSAHSVPMICNPFFAELALAGPVTVSADFSGQIPERTWFASALANNALRRDLISGRPDSGFLEPPFADDIFILLNDKLDRQDPACLGGAQSWYYGLDHNPPANRIDLLAVVLQEIGHGLGFQTYIDPTTGALLADGLPGSPCENGCPDAFSRNVYDLTQNLHWHEMTDAQRAASAFNDPNVVWTGPNVTALLPDFLDPGPDGELLGTNQGYLRLHAPDPVAPGISISHWTPDATPDLLMEAFLTENQGPLDVTPAALRDIGWPDPLTTVDVPMLRPAGFFVLGLIFAVLGALRVRRDFN